MSILANSASPEQINIMITKSEFKHFRNGAPIDKLQEISDEIRTQVEIIDLNSDGPKKSVKVRGYKNRPVDRWGPEQFIRFIKDQHKEAFGSTIQYLSDDRSRTLAAVAGLMSRFKARNYEKHNLVQFIEWLFVESESTEVTFSHICTNRLFNEWEILTRGKRKPKSKPQISKSFKRRMHRV